MKTPVSLGEATFTTLGVRLRPVQHHTARHGSKFDWLLFPGGPGIGSESLLGLAQTADLPGTTWLVDLPGDGSNVDAPGAPLNPYTLWPQVLLEAVDAVPAPIAVGHSTGGAYLLSVPELEHRLNGLVLISCSPDSGWMAAFEAMCATNPIPDVAAATLTYEADPTPEHLRQLVVASAPWNFTLDGLADGRDLLAQMPYNPSAVDWSADHFDRQYISRWWPNSLPTLIISGAEDRIVDQALWNDPYYRNSNVQRVTIDNAGHFPWIEQPHTVRAAFHHLAPAPPTEVQTTSTSPQPRTTDPSQGFSAP